MMTETPRDVLWDTGRLCSTSSSTGRIVLDFSRGHASQTMDDDDVLVAGALDALATLRHPLTAFAVLHLSRPLRLPSSTTLAYLSSCGLTVLELQDASLQRAASDGASNLLRSHPHGLTGQVPGESLADSIRVRGAAMVQFACSLPSLRRLSLCSAAFAASDIAALSSLTQLEELSLVGAMECGGPSASASPEPALPQRPKLLDGLAAVSTYKQLIAALPNLRRLRLPMPVAASSYLYGRRTTSDGWDSEEEVYEDEAEDINDSEDDCGSWVSMGNTVSNNGLLSVDNSSTSTDASNSDSSVCTCFLASAHFDLPTQPAPAASRHQSTERLTLSNFDHRDCPGPGSASVSGGCGCSCGNSGLSIDVKSSLVAAGWCGELSDNAPRTRMGPRTRSMASPFDVRDAALPRQPSLPITTTTSTVAASAACAHDPASRSWCFPPHLEELTIPLCSLNGPIFRAACEAYGGLGSAYGSEGTEAGGMRLPHRCLRALHVTCAPGYTVWEGSFLNSDRDFAALARLSSLESLHLCLELGGHSRSALRRDHLRRCFRHLRALHRMQDLRIEGTRRPLCFSTRKASPISSSLDDSGDCRAREDILYDLFGSAANEYGNVAALVSADEPSRPPLMALPLMPRLGSVSGTKQRIPPPFAIPWPTPLESRLPFRGDLIPRPWVLPAAHPSPVGACLDPPYNLDVAMDDVAASVAPSCYAAPAPATVSSPRSAPSLDSLLADWPQLQTLAVWGQCAIRSSRDGQTRLVLPESVQQLTWTEAASSWAGCRGIEQHRQQ